MTEQRRWLLFFLLTFIAIQVFTLLGPKKPVTKPEGSAPGIPGAVAPDLASTATLEAASGTTSTAVAAEAAAPATSALVEGTTVPKAQRPGPITSVKTDNYAIDFDAVGGVIRSLRLLDPGSESFKRDQPTSGVELVRALPKPDPRDVLPLEISFAEQGGSPGAYEEFNHVLWDVSVVSEGGPDKAAVVRFDSPTIRGLRLRKVIEIPPDAYMSKLTVTMFNETTNRVSIYDSTVDSPRGLGLRWGPGLLDRKPGDLVGEDVYDSALLRINGEVEVVRPDPDDDPTELFGDITWAGVESKFFTALMIPIQSDDAAKRENHGFRALVPGSHVTGIKGYTPPSVVELQTSRFDLEPGASRTFGYDIYIGPKKHKTLKSYEHALQAAMFPDAFFFMRPIYLGLTDFLNFLYRLVGNYGLAIIALTVVVRLLVFPLTQKQIKIQARTMAEMSKIKPHLDAINEKYKNDRTERDKRVWQVYREHNVSPFAPLRGCLPLLLQMPIFIGLYRVTNDTIDLQGANFLWIDDLSHADHLFALGIVLPIVGGWFNLLPIIMGATQMLATWVGMKRAVNMDPTQKQMMYFMPLVLTFMLYTLPAGLMVYWCTSNVWQIFQTMLTNRMMEREEAKHKAEGGGAVIAGGAPGGTPKPGSAASDFDAQQKKKGSGGGQNPKGKSVNSLPDRKKK